MTILTRRRFLQGSAALSTAMFLPHARAQGANDDIHLGVVGFHGRGSALINSFSSVPGVRIVALCDVDSKVLGGKVKELEAKHRGKVAAYSDIRKLLDDKNVDAVVVATPNHWHSLAGIWACQAGKHVYVEKPVSHNVWEGRQLVKAARKYDRVAAVGTQNRSSTAVIPGIEFVKQGKLGEVQMVRGLCHRRRPSIGKTTGPQPVPEHIDYDLWCGPGPHQPLRRKNLHYDWHWVFDYGNGDAGNQGIHEFDLCRWAAGHDGLPRSVISAGGRLGYDDDGDTPNTLITLLDYDTVPIVFEVRGLAEKKNPQDRAKEHGVGVGIVVECENGRLLGGRKRTWAEDLDGNMIQDFPGDGGATHYANFIGAVRSGDRNKLNAEILEGHLSSCLPHLANASYQVGRPSSVEETKDQLASYPLAQEAFQRMAAHLDANGVDIETDEVMLGPALIFDPDAERFVNNEVANALVRPQYRPPFEVPAEV